MRQLQTLCKLIILVISLTSTVVPSPHHHQEAHVKINSINNSTIVTDGIVSVGFIVEGHVNTSRHSDVGFCLHSTVDNNLSLSPLCYSCDVKNGEFKRQMKLTFRYSAMTLKLVVIVFDRSLVMNENENESESESTLAKEYVIIDILNYGDHLFAPVSDVMVNSYKRYLLVSNVQFRVTSTSSYNELMRKTTDTLFLERPPIRTVIYFNSLIMSGSNIRLARFGCYACLLKSKDKVFFLIDNVKETGPLLSILNDCKCPLLYVQSLDSTKQVTTLNATFVKQLHHVDFLIAPNTYGDHQTDALFQSVREMHLPSLSIILDLCNHYSFESEFEEKWPVLVDGLISPSLYMTKHIYTMLSGKPVETVYPACAEKSTLSVVPWPRKRNGRFQVGYFGRLTAERSPGLFVRVVSHMLKNYNSSYIRSNFEFVVVGSGSLHSILIDLAKLLEVEKDISFLGYVDDLDEFICNADLVVNTMARGENFGIMQVYDRIQNV